MPIGNERGREIFLKAGALVEGHFRLNSGRDGLLYVAKGKLVEPGNEESFEEICQGIAGDLCGRDIATLVGPREGAVPYVRRVAQILTEKLGYRVNAVFASKCEDGSNEFYIKNEDAQYVTNMLCALIEDVTTSGGSGKRVVCAIHRACGNVLVAVVIWNRGRVTAKDVGVEELIAQIDIPIDDYMPNPEGAGECPGCADGIRYHGELGHGKNLPKDHPLAPLPAQ